MRSFVVLLLVAGCDLQPAPPATQRPAAPVTPAGSAAAAVRIDAGVAPSAVDAAMAPPADAMVVTDRCIGISEHIADALIAEETDPASKAAFVQARARTVRRTAEICTRDAWNEAVMKCYLAATKRDAIQACTKPPR